MTRLQEWLRNASRMWERQWWTRARLLRVLLLAVAVLLLLCLIPLTRYCADRMALFFRNDSWAEGELPAPRGRLLARNGAPLAWSTRHFSLWWRVPVAGHEARETLAILRSSVKGIVVGEAEVLSRCGGEVMLSNNLSGSELLSVSRLRESIKGLDVRSYTVRRRTNVSSLAALIGTVQVVDGRECGVSGAERTHDKALRGYPGRFRVMVDRSGKWLPETWQKAEEVRPGNDVYLPVLLPAAVEASATRP